MAAGLASVSKPLKETCIMNIIFLDWACFCREDSITALKELGHTVSLFFHKEFDLRKSPVFDESFDTFVSSGSYDIVFSYNFYPLIAEGCKRNGLKYVSFIYDSPHVSLYSYTIVYPCNYVFLFDQTQYLELKNMGIPTVYYFPLAGNADKINSLLKKPHNKSRYCSDISFVGSLYNEDHNLFDRLTGLSDYTKGYLDAVMSAQLKVYGYYFMEEVLTKDILSEMKQSMPYEAGNTGIQTDEYIYGNYFLGRKLAELDRIQTLTAIASKHPLKLYTPNRAFQAPGIQNMGTVDYETEMPYVFHYSKINLNITLKSIKSGIPLRAIDVMSTGGFLLTNYQADFFHFFEPDVDFVYYDSIDDLLMKIDYYLTHDEERERIAKNGQEKIRNYHSFTLHFNEIFKIINEERNFS